MANRKNTFLVKRSNVAGKVPAAGDLLLGELALNTADGILYASGTTANSIIPIGWDRVARTGDTMTGGLFTPYLSATTISATTYLNLPPMTGAYLPLSGGTVYGSTIYTGGLTANTLNVTGLTQTSGVTSTGGIIFPHKTLTTNYTATTSDYFLNITGDTLDITLLSAVGVDGKLLVIKNEGSGIVNVISQLGELIDDRTDVLLTQGNSVQLISDGENWVIIGYNISSTQANTGVVSFSGLSKVSSSTFYVAPVQGYIVDDTTNPTIPFLTFVEYSGGTHTDNYYTTAFETFVYITSGGTIGQQPTPLTPIQRRQNIFLGKLGHPDKTAINLVFSQPDYILTPLGQLRDMFIPINLINGGVYPSAYTGLTINTSAGNIYGLGINFVGNKLNPNSLAISGQSPCTFQYRTSTGGTVTNTTLIDPLNYDLNGVITPLAGTKATNQRIYLLQNGSFRIQYGQHVYANFAEAVQNLQTETFTEFPNFVNNAVLICILTILSSTTDLTDTSKAQFFFASKFGETAGATGGISTTNLQQAYNNSTNPEIVINAILDGLSIKNGTGNADNVTRLLEGQTGTNGITSFIRADGYISGTTFQSNGFIANSNGLTATTVSATTIKTPSFTANNGGITATTVSATTYYNLPKDIYTTGGTYSDNTFTYTNNTGGTFNVLFDTLTGLTVNGNVTITGNTVVGGILGGSTIISTQSIGDEGGDIKLSTAETNNTLSGNSVTVDMNQNRFRIFETGGSNRGVYIDLTAAGAGVSTNLLSGGGGEINTASNLGSGTGLFAQKVAADLQFKSLTSTGGTVTISNDANTVNLEVIAASNFTGGTVTGAANFTSGLSANTISATTYYNLPTDIRVTGGTYSNGSLLFTNNTGGTFNINTSTNYAAGVISGATYSMDGVGQINLPAIKVALFNNANNIEPVIVYDVASGTTGVGGIPELVDQDTNYIVVEYNGGSPRYYVYDNDGVVDDSSIVLFMIAYRTGSFVHTLEFGNQGAGLANKLNDRFIMTDRFGWESGLSLSLSASTGIVMVTSGVAWNGPNRQSLTDVNSSGSTFFKNFHSGGTWTYTTTGDTINNTYYDNGTDIVSATASKYLTNWYFRGQEVNSHLYEVYGNTEYDNVALAQLAKEPTLPELITSHAILLGRVIIQVGASTGLTESAFSTVFQSTQVTSHNDLTSLQGGTSGEYYHLTSNQYNNLVLTNQTNTFTEPQIFNSGLTSTSISANTTNIVTVSATTVTADVFIGDGSQITNITVPYGIITAMSTGNYLI